MIKYFTVSKNTITMPKKYEKSSGWIVYREVDGKVQILLLEWLNSRKQKELVIPKWKIEWGEVAKDTAIREISEESWLPEKDLEVIKFVTKLNYTYTAGYLDGNPVVDKDVYLFIVKYTGDATPIVRKQERFTGYKWIDIDDVNDFDVRFDLAGIVYRNKPFFV